MVVRDRQVVPPGPGVQAPADQQGLHGPAGPVASTPTIWRVLAGIDTAMLGQIRQARAEARDRAWTGRGELTGAEPPGSRASGKTIAEVVIDRMPRSSRRTRPRKTLVGTSKAASGITP